MQKQSPLFSFFAKRMGKVKGDLARLNKALIKVINKVLLSGL